MDTVERKGTILETLTEGETVYQLREDGNYYKLYAADTNGDNGYFCG